MTLRRNGLAFQSLDRALVHELVEKQPDRIENLPLWLRFIVDGLAESVKDSGHLPFLQLFEVCSVMLALAA
jgi:hypothetical protein